MRSVPTHTRKAKRVSAAEAISLIQPGDHLVLAGMAAEPRDLVKELIRQQERLHDVTIYTSFPVEEPLYGSQDGEGAFRIKTFSVGSLREAIRRKQACYLPCHFSEIGKLFLTRTLPVDGVLVQVSPPDNDGFCSFGVSVEYYPEVVSMARLTIAEVNPRMPRTHGNSWIHETAFDFLVEAEHLLPEYVVGPPSEVERGIAENCATLVADGSVLQFGPGRIQSAILLALFGKRDLGIHSGLISDPVVELVERGALTGRSKTLDKGKIVCTAAIGTAKLYSFINENPIVEFQPASYTHNISVLAKLKAFISLNVALEVDLLGQVNSETVNGTLLNGVGGMMDFIRGAKASEGGKVVFCFASRAKEGQGSRIVPSLSPRSPVTVTRADMDYLVSEYGVATLAGKTVKERAEAICEIAHPDFREELKRHVEELSYC